MKTYYNTMTDESFTLKQPIEQGATHEVEIKEGVRLVAVVDFHTRAEAMDFIYHAVANIPEREAA